MSQSVESVISKLIQRLHDADPVVRRNAAGALRLHGRRAFLAADELARLTHDDDACVRREAQRALSRLREPAA